VIRRLAAAGLLAALLALGGAGAASAAPEDQRQETAEHGQAGGGEPEQAPKIDAGKLAMQFLNFAILVGVLVFFGRKPLRQALQARHEQLKADLAAAAEARTAAAARLDKQNARLASLEQEIADIRAGIKEEAEAEKARMIAAAEDRARRIQEETAFVLDQQVKEAQAQLKREVAEMAVRIGEEIVKRSLTGADQQRMLDSFVNEVAGDGAPGPVGPSTDGAAAARRPQTRGTV
jgi:F-type H+-transporting ATPase subunit b